MLDKWCFLQKALVLLICLPPLLSNAQHDPFTGIVVDRQSVDLNNAFDAYHVYTLDLVELSRYVQSEEYDNHVSLNLPGYGEFEVDLFHNPLKAENYRLSVQTESGVVTIPNDGVVKTFLGYLAGGQYQVRLTIDDDFISGFIELPKDELYFESLRFRDLDASSDQVLVYKKSSITEEFQFDCDPLEVPGHISKEDEQPGAERAVGDCLEVEIALADDWLMYQDHGQSVTDVENHNMAVMNNVQANYDNEFADELQFVVVEIFVSTCNTCDPWSSSTNPGTLLNSFGGWAPGGFSVGFDVANLWSDRNFNGSTVGLAWLDAVCSSFKYNVLQDFTANANFLRVLQAHELGHNFGSGHDPSGSGTIMAPSINNTNTWSTSSVNQINGYVNSINCLAICSSSLPPVASFGSDLEEGCSPLSVQFFDNSTGEPDSWNWTFEGGDPATSSEQNPEVIYVNSGSYDVTLEVFNSSGSDITTSQDYIVVLPDPVPDFTFAEDELTIYFENLSVYADSYLWEFGDGQTSSAIDPVHTYDSDGFYNVTLSAFNECGVMEFTLVIEVISQPIAGFTYDSEEGCEPLIVNFYDASSSNVDYYLWDFPGGSPSFSTQANPVVTYNNPGIYEVSLTVFNEAGEDLIVMEDLVVVYPLPVADFTFSVAGAMVDFTNLSENADAFSWDFGDGSSAAANNPTHEYQNGGLYTVTLFAENNCGVDIAVMQISVESAPVAGIGISLTEGCSPLQVEYSSTSSGDVDMYVWSFPGGTPTSSTAMSPIVTYNSAGVYDAELIVTNAVGSDTIFITNAVVVQEPVFGAFSFDVNGSTANFLNESTGEETVMWEIAGVEYTEENPSVLFPEDGVYTAQLIVMGPCGSDTVLQNVTIATLPTAGVAPSSTNGCEPFTVKFKDQSTSNVIAWEWSFPGGFPSSSNAKNPLVTYQEPGVYSMSLTVTSAIGTDYIAIDDLIIVDPLPEAFFGTIQSGTEVEFENSSIDATSYLWLFGDGNSSIEENPVHDFGEFGQFEIQLIASNDCGSDTVIVDLQLAALPIPWFTANVDFGCAPFEVQFTDASQNGAEEWEWSFPGGNPSTSDEQNPIVIYDVPGYYDITLRVSNVAGAQSLVREEYIEVGPEPVSEFSVEIDGDEVTFSNLSLDADNYYWDFGDNETDSTEHPVHIYNSTGNYTVILVASNLCGSDTFSIEVAVQTTATVVLENAVDFDLWPNPNDGSFNVEIKGYKGTIDLVLVDIMGRIVYSNSINAPAGIEVSKRDELAPGLYHMIVRGKDFKDVVKVVVQ